MTASQPAPRVGLFATCLVDLFRPSVGFSAAKLIEDAGCAVHVPMAQTCCGQPAYNSGDRKDARALAIQVIELFEDYDYVVAPSGSCAAMLKHHYPELFKGDVKWEERCRRFSDKVFELVSFLTDVMFVPRVDAAFHGSVTYHDSCSGLRELGVEKQPRKLLATVDGLELKEMAGSDVCCGFGGTFSIKQPEISAAMVADKVEDIRSTGGSAILSGDCGCLMNIGGAMERAGVPVAPRHLAEFIWERING